MADRGVEHIHHHPVTGGTDLGDGACDIRDREANPATLPGVLGVKGERDGHRRRVEFAPHCMHGVTGIAGWDVQSEYVAVERRCAIHVGNTQGNEVDGTYVHTGPPDWKQTEKLEFWTSPQCHPCVGAG